MLMLILYRLIQLTTPRVRRLMKTKEVRKKSRNLKIFAKTPCSRCKWQAVHEGSWPGLLTGLSRPLLWSAVDQGAGVRAKPPGRGWAQPRASLLPSVTERHLLPDTSAHACHHFSHRMKGVCCRRAGASSLVTQILTPQREGVGGRETDEQTDVPWLQTVG